MYIGRAEMRYMNEVGNIHVMKMKNRGNQGKTEGRIYDMMRNTLAMY